MPSLPCRVVPSSRLLGPSRRDKVVPKGVVPRLFDDLRGFCGRRAGEGLIKTNAALADKVKSMDLVLWSGRQGQGCLRQE